MANDIFQALPHRLTRNQIGAGAGKAEGQSAQGASYSHWGDDVSFARMVGGALRLEMRLDDGSLLACVMDAGRCETQPDQRRAGGEGRKED